MAQTSAYKVICQMLRHDLFQSSQVFCFRLIEYFVILAALDFFHDLLSRSFRRSRGCGRLTDVRLLSSGDVICKTSNYSQ